MAVCSEAVRRDWTELNLELLHLISKKLGNLSNFIRFRSVCKQWRSAADPADPPPWLPWLLQPATLCQQGDRMRTDYILYSLSSHSTSKIELPITHYGYRYHCCREPFIGFILVDQFRIKSPYLFNPLNETKIDLPFSEFERYFSVYMGLDDKSNSSTVKSGVHLVVYTLVKGGTEIGFWRSDSNEFTMFTIPIRSRVFGYYRGKLFVCVFERKETKVCDMTSGAEMNIVIPHPAECPRISFFVEGMGDLLAVQCPYQGEGECDIHEFKVYRLEHTDDFGQCRWIKLKGIGERVLFLGSGCAGFCLSAADFEGLRGNCIYYLQNCRDITEDDDLLYNRLLRYDMENATSEELLNCIPLSAAWFMPCFR